MNGVQRSFVFRAPCNKWTTKKFCFYSPLQQIKYIQVLFQKPLATSGKQRKFVFIAPCNEWNK